MDTWRHTTEQGCWEWLGARNRQGYGRYGATLVHRQSYSLHVGPIPDDHGVRQTCGVRVCFNPDHLDLAPPGHDEALFWSRTRREGSCLIWTGGLHTRGDYGQYGDHSAHRLAYTLSKGPIPPGLEVDHLCFTPLCVNPEHLEAVTHAENMRRRFARVAGAAT